MFVHESNDSLKLTYTLEPPLLSLTCLSRLLLPSAGHF